MPSAIGNVKINSISSSGVLHLGDSIYMSPKSTTVGHSGAGAGTTGDFLLINNIINGTNSLNPHLADSNIKSI